jgi:hypothetical protein
MCFIWSLLYGFIGESWEKGFSDGLVKSSIFMPILSRGSINDSTNPRSNFTKLTETSNCDNMLLEYRIALDLFARGMLDFVYPIMIGLFIVTKALTHNS